MDPASCLLIAALSAQCLHHRGARSGPCTDACFQLLRSRVPTYGAHFASKQLNRCISLAMVCCFWGVPLQPLTACSSYVLDRPTRWRRGRRRWGGPAPRQVPKELHADLRFIAVLREPVARQLSWSPLTLLSLYVERPVDVKCRVALLRQEVACCMSRSSCTSSQILSLAASELASFGSSMGGRVEATRKEERWRVKGDK